jgi:hypothetical protein
MVHKRRPNMVFCLSFVSFVFFAVKDRRLRTLAYALSGKICFSTSAMTVSVVSPSAWPSKLRISR